MDKGQAAAFLNVLGKPPFIFQTFTDNKEAKKKFPKVRGKSKDPLARALIGTLDHHWPALVALNDAGAGVFVQVNEGTKRGNKYVTGIRSVFVDFDEPPATLTGLPKAITESLIRPFAIVQSSPGKAHLYWKVKDTSTETFTKAQKILAEVYKADKEVHNPDRVMRLPGTVHRKGIPFDVTCVVKDSSSLDPETLDKWLGSIAGGISQVQDNSHSLLNSIPAHCRENGNSAASLQVVDTYELPSVLAPGNRTQPLIAYIGHLVGKGYSEEYIRNEVIKANVERCPNGEEPIPEGVLQAEILDAIPRFIFNRDSTGSTGPNATQENDPFAQVKAGTQVSALDLWEEQYVLIESGKRVADLNSHPTTAIYTIEEFSKSKANRYIGKTPAVPKWLASSKRKTVRDTSYLPGATRVFTGPTGHDYYNTFIATYLQRSDSFDVTKIAPFIDHLKLLFSKPEDFKRFLQWCAFSVQKPELRIPWCPLIVSSPGVGKGWLFQCLSMMLGPHNCKTIGSDDLGDKGNQFNEWMSESLLVCIDEMYTQHKWDMMERVKTLITESNILINRKYGKKSQDEVFCNFIAFSNHLDAAALTKEDRRFWVVHTKEKARSSAYYSKLFNWLKTDGPSHLLTFLSTLDISDFDYAASPPMTDAKEMMIDASVSSIEVMIVDAILDRRGIFSTDIVDAGMVEDFVLVELNQQNLSKGEKSQVQHILAGMNPPLPQKRYRVKVPGAIESVRKRLQIIRNKDIWLEAPQEEVIDEFIKAFGLSVGKMVSAPVGGTAV
ncbi:MAG: hypothetical protein KAS32_29630 [Candidatus Peribacteraceae bacterium]|nr:hypothetical protein [Candidatus Peribacteraceae bacterium]